jgi:hypothetical protein
LDILDFSEFLLQMHGDAGVFENWARLARYYARHGRVNEVVYGLIAVNYRWFELDPLAWQALRAVQMLIVPFGVYLVLRRLGGTRFGSVLGASLFLFGSVPASNWLRQTAEPIATVFLLGATALVSGISQAPASWRRTVGIFMCVAGMLLSKETLVACIPFLVLIASCWQANGTVRAFRFDRRTLEVLAACGTAVALLAGTLLWAHSIRQEGAYANLYGSASVGEGLWLGRLVPLILPVTLGAASARELILFPSNLVFVGLLGTGLLVSLRWLERGQVHRKLLIASALPIAGLIVYLPWPRFELFYGLPFLLGPSLWVAVLLGHLGLNRRWNAALSVCWIFVLTVSAITAADLAGYTRARREANQALAVDLSAQDPRDTVIVASARLTPQAWQNPAATLGRYAIATRIARTTPVLIDMNCDQSAEVAAQRPRGSTLYVYGGGCDDLGTPDRRIQKPFVFFDWSSARVRTETFNVDVFERP